MIKPIILLEKPTYNYIEKNKKYLLLVFTPLKTAKYLVEIKDIHTISSEIVGINLTLLKCFSDDLVKCKIIENLTKRLKNKIEITDKDNLADLQKDFYLKNTFYPGLSCIKNISNILQNSSNDDIEIRTAIYNYYNKNYKDHILTNFAEGYEIFSNKIGAVLLSYSDDLHEQFKTSVNQKLQEKTNNNDVVNEITSYLDKRHFGGKTKKAKSKRKCTTRKNKL